MQIEKISSSHSLWQSSTWESILHDSGQTRDIEVVTLGSEGVMIEYRSIGLGMMGAFSLGIDDLHLSAEFIAHVERSIRARGAIFWQLEIYIPHGVPSESVRLETYGRHFLEPWTRTIDLRLDESAIMDAMHEKGRYNIRLAWKRGVMTEWVAPTSEHIDIWMGLLDDTMSRDGFVGNSREYYISFVRNLHEAHMGGLLFARYEGQVIAAGIWVYYHGVALYYYGASTSDPEMRKHMAPYLLQWEAMREGKARGCHTYDLLGIAPPDEPESHLAGVSGFKERFGGQAIMIGSKHLFVYGKIRYFLFQMMRKVRNIFRKK